MVVRDAADGARQHRGARDDPEGPPESMTFGSVPWARWQGGEQARWLPGPGRYPAWMSPPSRAAFATRRRGAPHLPSSPWCRQRSRPETSANVRRPSGI
ncbi:hypothetical protein FAIPA1_430044 [Frankia sp. AiPs1]